MTAIFFKDGPLAGLSLAGFTAYRPGMHAMHAAITVGPVTLANPVAVAPMSGVSDLPFRRVAARAGAGLIVSEMVASRELARARPDMVRRTLADPDIGPFAIQLAGCEPRWMAEGARQAEAAGADIVDINMGCPARQVTGQLAGSALMRDLDHALRLIEATVSATSKPVTLKMRLGWDRDCLNAAELARRSEAAGVRMVTVHGRTRNQFFTGKADWRAVRAVTESVKIPVLVNGDIGDLASARQALEESRAHGVMIGRAAVGRPWLAGAIASALRSGGAMAAPPLERQLEIIIAQYRDTLEVYGPALGVRIARKHLAAFVDCAPVSLTGAERRSLRSAICTANDPEQAIGKLADLVALTRTDALAAA